MKVVCHLSNGNVTLEPDTEVKAIKSHGGYFDVQHGEEVFNMVPVSALCDIRLSDFSFFANTANSYSDCNYGDS